MSAYFRANSTAMNIRERLTAMGPETVHELNVNCCMIADKEDLCESIAMCSNLKSLSCIACPIPVSKLLWLMQEGLVQLRELSFSLLLSRSDTNNEKLRVLQALRQVPLKVAGNLRSVYAEVRGEYNAFLLSLLLRFCPGVTDIHVHFASGNFRLCLLQIETIVHHLTRMQSFTISSDVPAVGVEDEDSSSALFRKFALACGNVAVCAGFYSCVQLRDLALDSIRRELLSQLVVILNGESTEDEMIAEAAHGHDWSSVSWLTLVLSPQQPFAAEPTNECPYLGGLHELFSAATFLTELNVNSFHFKPDVDLTELLCGAQRLEALSTAPCGLRQPGAMLRLAEACPELIELDVRVEKRGTQHGCTICQLEFRLDGYMVALFEEGPPQPRRRLTRLTLSGVPRLESLLFLERCKVDELRLVDCLDVSSPDFLDIGELLACNDRLKFLLLRHAALPYGTTNLLNNVSRATRLRYLCLLTEVPLHDDIAEAHVEQLASGLPQLAYMDVHYRSMADGNEQRVSWLRRSSDIPGQGHLIRNGPCFMCSAATFIGLSKPLNRWGLII